jgi:hypothetical protein
MRIKYFWQEGCEKNSEDEINEWLASHDVEVKHVCQTIDPPAEDEVDPSTYILTSVWYEEKK